MRRLPFAGSTLLDARTDRDPASPEVPTTTPSARRDVPGLASASATFFLLWVASGFWTVAPMSISSVLAALALVAGIATRKIRWDPSPADRGATAWAIALLLAAAFALDRTASLGRLHKLAFPFLVGLAAAHARDERTGRRAAAVALVSLGLASAWGLVAWVLRGASFASRARGPVGHYLTFAGQLAIGTSLAIAIVLVARDRRWRLGAAAAGLLSGAALAGTFTRSSWLGLLGACAVMLALVQPWALAGLAAVVLLLVKFAPGDYGARLLSVFDLTSKWNEQREYMWQAGARMFRDHPWTGVGLEDLHVLYERYRSAAATEPAGHLHSVPVQVAATMGTVGLVALVVLFVTLALTAAHRLRARVRAGGLGAALALGATGALVAFAIAGLFEWNLGDEEVLHPLYALIGLAWAARRWSDAP